MKKLSLAFAITFLIVSANFAFAEDKQASTASSTESTSVQSSEQGNHKTMMQCPMVAQHKEMKVLIRSMLQLQQRSLNASSKQKSTINAEIKILLKKIDAMPDKMECPMMKMKQDAPSAKKDSPEIQPDEKAKPQEHKH